MLGSMDIPAPAGWIPLAVVPAILLLGLLAARVLRVRGRRGTPPAPARQPVDDLAGFHEHPPGTAGAFRPSARGWTPLSAPAAPEVQQPSSRPAHGHLVGRTVAAAAATLLLLAAVAFAVATGRDDGRRPGGPRADDSGPPSSDRAGPLAGTAVEARLSFGGVVLERHAVGVTATYPEVQLTGDDGERRAQLTLPTWNCLTGEAPADPVAAGCRRAQVEVATLTEPQLEVTGVADGLRMHGRFATTTRPNGSAPAPTGRTYELVVTVVPGGEAGDGWLSAGGVLQLGGDQARTTGTDSAAGVNVLRYR